MRYALFSSLKPLRQEIEAAPRNALCGVLNQHCPQERRADDNATWRLRELFAWMGIPESDLEFLTGGENFNTDIVINSGLLDGSRKAWTILDVFLQNTGAH